ncbi:MAG: DUF1292 domain-containing protein [Clostridia bacterium]|nr:DUF1292 domain-containing protein [Clostridia bacterium]
MDVVVLTDDEGNDVEFEWLDTVEYNGNQYIVVIPTDDDAEDVVILRMEKNDEEETFVGLEDEKEVNEVFDVFKEKNKENYEFID